LSVLSVDNGKLLVRVAYTLCATLLSFVGVYYTKIDWFRNGGNIMSKATLRIGVSGHQQIGDEATIEFVSQQLRELLATFQCQAQERGQNILAYSALALGTDQLFVKIALEMSVPVELVIPCSQYAEIFSTTEARNEYHHLLSRCQNVHRLPFDDCSEDAFLAAGHWIVDHSDLVILVWNGYSAAGKGGTADIASYARYVGRPFLHVHTRLNTVKQYGSLSDGSNITHVAAKRQFAVSKQTVYRGPVLTVDQYQLRIPNGEEIVRDIVERPESVLVLPVGQKNNVILIEEYDLGAENWQLTLPGGKVDDPIPEGIHKQAEVELREEIGYRPGRLEKLLDFYSHPGYIGHKVHLMVAYDLEWDPLEMEDGEEIRVHTFTLDEALAATREDYRCDPEAALALWLYKGKKLD
jgi:8-oxo-dGTP pyrophosphatase MutT (NUDIX family)